MSSQQSAKKAIERRPPPASSLEKCSFVCHIFVVPIGLLYLLWALVPPEILEEKLGDNYFPRKEYSLHLPVSAVFFFLAAPLIYAGLNAMTVPKVDSMDTLQDMHTRRQQPPPCPTDQRRMTGNDVVSTCSLLPEICDLDPATLVWCDRQEKEGNE
jgi:hypothetical protein